MSRNTLMKSYNDEIPIVIENNGRLYQGIIQFVRLREIRPSGELFAVVLNTANNVLYVETFE